MKQVTYCTTPVLLGDEVADLLLCYSAMLITSHVGDTVSVKALSMNGDKIDVSFLLGGGAGFMSQSSFSSLLERDNAAAVLHMTDEMALLMPPAALGFDPDAEMLGLGSFSYDDWTQNFEN